MAIFFPKKKVRHFSQYLVNPSSHCRRSSLTGTPALQVNESGSDVDAVTRTPLDYRIITIWAEGDSGERLDISGGFGGA